MDGKVAGLCDRAAFAFRRRAQLLSCPHIPPGERVRLLLSRDADPIESILSRVRRDSGAMSIAIDGFRFSVPDEDEEAVRQGRHAALGQVIAETFVQPTFFRGPVRVRPGDVVLDLGANIGTTVAILARRVGPSGRVYAFEPNLHAILRENVEANHLANVEILPVAVGDHRGTITMSIGPSGIDGTTIRTLDWQVRTCEVPLLTLDQFVEERGIERIDFIKVDIEGAEEQAIRGAEKTIERFRPKWSISSYHRDFEGERQHPKLVALLEQRGYRVREVPYFHIWAY